MKDLRVVRFREKKLVTGIEVTGFYYFDNEEEHDPVRHTENIPVGDKTKAWEKWKERVVEKLEKEKDCSQEGNSPKVDDNGQRLLF